MRRLAEWLTAHPLRGLAAAGVAALVALPFLPLSGWLPAAIVVLVLLVRGPRAAGLVALGAGLLVYAGFAGAFGGPAAAGVALAVLLPAWLLGALLAGSRSLSLTCQVAALGAGGLVLLLHALAGDPAVALAPLVERAMPVFEQMAALLAGYGLPGSAAELGNAVAGAAWATLAWLVLANALAAVCAGLWAYGGMREPGLFGREFRALRLGRVLAWVAVAALALQLALPWLAGRAWQPAGDLLFVLAAAFLVQALAVVHALRESQAIGMVPVVIAYLAAVLAPAAMVGLGLADTWVRFRERFGAKPAGRG